MNLLKIRPVIALIVFLGLVVLWVLQLLVSVPFILVAYVMVACPKHSIQIDRSRKRINDGTLVYNRITDVSKIYGCYTRNVLYTWDIFTKALEKLKQSKNGQVIDVLELGAGSLRDTYEMSKLGCRVTAIDMDKKIMDKYYQYYDWDKVQYKPILVQFNKDSTLSSNKYDLIMAFDVLEHLYKLDETLAQLKNNLSPQGLLICTVPNKRAWFEKYYEKKFMENQKKGITDTTGKAHVQFKTPEEWRKYFMTQKYIIEVHDMTLGFLVNDLWHGFYGLAIRKFIEPYIIKLCSKRRSSDYRQYSLEELFYPAWLMSKIDLVDKMFKPLFLSRWGWNLFVLSKEEQ